MKCQELSEMRFPKVWWLYRPCSRGKRPFKVCRRWRRSGFHRLQVVGSGFNFVGSTAYAKPRSAIFVAAAAAVLAMAVSGGNSRYHMLEPPVQRRRGQKLKIRRVGHLAVRNQSIIEILSFFTCASEENFHDEVPARFR